MKKDNLNITGMHDDAAPSVFRNAQKLRDNMTEPELKLCKYLKMKPMGYKFRRQHSIAGYVLDFYCHKLRWSIEIDGSYHMQKEQMEKDRERTEHLENLGTSEIRLTNQQVLNDYDKTIEIINSNLRAGTL